MTQFNNLPEAIINRRRLEYTISIERMEAIRRQHAHARKVNNDPQRIDPRISWSKALLHDIVARETGLLFIEEGQKLFDGKTHEQFRTPVWLYEEFKAAYAPRAWTQEEAIAWAEENKNE